jgi:hypothetical protein
MEDFITTERTVIRKTGDFSVRGREVKQRGTKFENSEEQYPF